MIRNITALAGLDIQSKYKRITVPWPNIIVLCLGIVVEIGHVTGGSYLIPDSTLGCSGYRFTIYIVARQVGRTRGFELPPNRTLRPNRLIKQSNGLL